MSRGSLIVFEGVDRSGKTTLSRRLAEAVPGAVLFRFPDRTTPVGRVIDQCLSMDNSGRGDSALVIGDDAIHLLMSKNRWEKGDEIKTALLSGKTVICDRYCYSGVAYSMAKALASRPPAWYKAPDSGLPRPDIVLYLDTDPEEAAQRPGYGDEIYEQVAFQAKVRREYEKLRDEDAERWTTVITAGKSVAALEVEILEKIVDRATTDAPLDGMWEDVL